MNYYLELEKNANFISIIKFLFLFMNFNITLRCNTNLNILLPEFEVRKGLRQGCYLAPTLFKMYLNETLRVWRRKCGNMGKTSMAVH